ncbi:conserved membrane hypothetical protein [Gammaproteobacteria bacterium]
MTWSFRKLVAFGALIVVTVNTWANPPDPTPPVVEPDKALLGAYVVSIHDLNFGANTFGADFWVWTDYENPRLQPLKTMELINAKSSTTSLLTTQQKEHQTWSQQKVQGTFRHSWDMSNFPFDRHILTIFIEEALDDTSRFHYLSDTKNNGYAKDIAIDGFAIRKMTVETTQRDYDSNFGDPSAPSTSSYSQLRINLELERVSRMLFLKLHTALYAAFLVSAFCFPLLPQLQKTPQLVGSVLSAIVGSLFAAVINLRTADAVIGRSESLTLVDRLHFVTFLYFIVLGMLAVRILTTRERWTAEKLYRFSRWAGGVYVMSYIVSNALLVWWAAY